MSYTVDNKILCSPLLEQMPGWMFIKNLELKYTSTTLRSALLCGFKNQQDKYGKSDYELNCKASESAQFFQEQDNKVISEGREISFLQLNQYADNQVHVFFTKKTPLKRPSGKIIGVCGIVEEVSNPVLTKAIFNLVNVGKLDPILTSNKRNFQIDGSDFFNQLSDQETEVVFYFIRGLSNKEISLSMQIPLKVIDFILENIKNKFNFNSTKDFYNYCLTHQIYSIIPQKLIQRSIASSDKVFDPRKFKTEENLKSHIKLTKRQQQCVNLLLTGATSHEIAQKLNLSTRTIESRVDQLKAKFYARNKADLIAKLCRYF